jgi:acyl-coenzyme A synthetase/AMP-(fatty) acid ligase
MGVGLSRGAGAEEAVMSEETVGSTGQPKGLLQQMEELMAALNADLSALEALQSAGGSGRALVDEGEVG